MSSPSWISLGNQVLATAWSYRSIAHWYLIGLRSRPSWMPVPRIPISYFIFFLVFVISPSTSSGSKGPLAELVEAGKGMPTGSYRTAARPSDRPERSTPRSSLACLLGETAEAEALACGGGHCRFGSGHSGDGGCVGRSDGVRRAESSLGTRVDLFRLVHLHGRLLGLVARFHVQVVGRLHAALPRRVIDVHHVAEVACLEVHVAADGLVDPLLGACRNLKERVRRQLEAGLVDGFDVIRDRRDVLDVALAAQDRLA